MSAVVTTASAMGTAGITIAEMGDTTMSVDLMATASQGDADTGTAQMVGMGPHAATTTNVRDRCTVGDIWLTPVCGLCLCA